MINILFLKLCFYIFFFLQLNNAIYMNSGIKTLNKFLYYSRYKEYYNQNENNKCSLNDGPNCYFTENKYIENYKKNDEIKNKSGINNEWIFFYNKTQNYEYKLILQYFDNYTKNYKEKNRLKIDKDQNSQDEVFQYLMTFDNFDELTIKNDIYFNEKLMNTIFYNKEFNIVIQGKLKLSYDNDLSEHYLTVINKDYPSNTFGIIESNFISISFGGKAFVCNFCYIKQHDKQSKSNKIFFTGYIGDKGIFTTSYTDNKKRNEKWLKVLFPTVVLINKLVIAGPFDIDNISFTFPNKQYKESNVYNNYNHKNIEILVKDEDI